MEFENRKQRRTRLSGIAMDKVFRRHTRFMAKSNMTAARDYYNAVSSAGHNPLPVTSDKLQAGYEYLRERGGLSAKRRSRAWLVALRALPIGYQSQIGVDQLGDLT